MIDAADPDLERGARAVEEPHHDVASVVVGAEEELAARGEPLRPDRDAAV